METSRVVRVRRHGGPEALLFEDRPVPEPGPGEVLVRLETMALNHLDLWVRGGIPGVRFPLPLVPGSDGCGTIERLGPGVLEPAEGTRVVVLPGLSCGRCRRCLAGDDNLCASYAILGEARDGTSAEHVLLPAANVAPAPPRLDDDAAAAFPLTFLTAWNMVVRKGRAAPGTRLLVHAAASGVGSAAIQIARLVGARVAATAGAPAKLDLARRLGADDAFDYGDPDWTAKARAWAGSEGIDVVVDSVGAATFAPSLRLLARGGRYVFCGATSGFELQADFRPIFFKNQEILGSTMGRRADLLRALELAADGKLVPVIDGVFPFARIGEAHERLASRRNVGKVVVRIAPRD